MKAKAIKVLVVSLLLPLLTACAGVEVDTTPYDRFTAGNYSTYSWRIAPTSDGKPGSSNSIAVINPALRATINTALSEKGYREVGEGGEFVIAYQFKARLADGALSSASRASDNQYPYQQTGAILNREPDQALIDNAYALGGPRKMNSIVIRFYDGQSEQPVWAMAISKMVEDVNRETDNFVVEDVKNAVIRGLNKLPTAH